MGGDASSFVSGLCRSSSFRWEKVFAASFRCLAATLLRSERYSLLFREYSWEDAAGGSEMRERELVCEFTIWQNFVTVESPSTVIYVYARNTFPHPPCRVKVLGLFYVRVFVPTYLSFFFILFVSFLLIFVHLLPVKYPSSVMGRALARSLARDLTPSTLTAARSHCVCAFFYFPLYHFSFEFRPELTSSFVQGAPC